MKQRNTIYVRVLLVVLAIVILLVFSDRGGRPTHHDTWLPSSYNPVGAGSMPLFQTLQQLNWPVERWREPLSRLNSLGTGNVLIITRSRTGAPPVSFSVQEDDLLIDWARRGNTLILLGAFDEWDDTRELLRDIGFPLPDKTPGVNGLWQALAVTPDQALALAPNRFDSLIGASKAADQLHDKQLAEEYAEKIRREGGLLSPRS